MSYITIKIQGGLGNQLFQLATAYAYSQKHNRELVIEELQTSPSIFNPRPTYWKTFLQKFQRYLLSSSVFKNKCIDYQIYKEASTKYQTIPNYSTKGIYLDGYFCMSNYFLEYRKQLLSLFALQIEEEKYLTSKYNFINFNNSICVHIRRGDYLKLSGHHNNLTLDYYKKAVAVIQKNSKVKFLYVVVFSDDQKWCQEHFKLNLPTVYIQESKDYYELMLMSYFSYKIIANSTFSWWAAYLGTKNKIVVAPRQWAGPEDHRDLSDRYESDWIIV
jgi:hypothetical protein